MPENSNSGAYSQVFRFLNEAATAEDLMRALKAAGTAGAEERLAHTLLARRTAVGGALTKADELEAGGLSVEDLSKLADAVAELQRQDEKIEPERRNFSALLLQNPNYFGTFPDSGFDQVSPIQGNTNYEQLTCIGLNPPFDRLEAIVQVKLNYGYGGPICAAGTLEYVRFFVDVDDNGTFEDVGLASVRVHDILGPKPLCYSVFLDFDSIRRICRIENVVRMRAILSWNVPPPPGNPNHVPVWGNRRDAEIQIHPRPKLQFPGFLTTLEEAGTKIPDAVLPLVQAIEPSTELELKEQPALSVAERKRIYERQDVPAARYAFPEVHELVTAAGGAPVVAVPKQTALTQIGLDDAAIQSIIDSILNPGDGNKSFEELNCIGLRPESDLLEGVLTIKRKFGYGGPLCAPGTREYVAFWVDFNDGSGFTYMGTTSVVVHDLQQVPDDGLKYAVFLKGNLAQKLIPCFFGAKIVRLRAILSWSVPPPPGNPNWVPFWGNREDCRIQLRPGFGFGHVPFLETVGNVLVADINAASGLTNSNIAMQGVAKTLNDAPFGGGVSVGGRITNPPDSFGGGAQPFKYKIEVARFGTANWQPLTDEMVVAKTDVINGIPSGPTNITLTPTDDGDGLGPGWYSYIEDLAPPHQRFLVQDLLARWQTNSSMEGDWQMRMTAKDPSTSPPTVYPGGQLIRIRVDNTRPTVALAITGATVNGNPVPATDCGKFPTGAVITGTFAVSDPGTSAPLQQHHGDVSFSVEPVAPANGATVTPTPAVLSYPVVSTNGVSGTWELDTGAPGHEMKPCGYVVRMVATDRANVHSAGNHHQTPISVGFCLEEPE